MSQTLANAIDRRRRLFDADTNAVRLVHGQSDGLDGLVIEQLADVLVVQLHAGRLALSEPEVRDLCESARVALGARAVYRKHFLKDRSGAPCAAIQRGGLSRDVDHTHEHYDAQPWLGATVPPEFPVRERAASFLVRPYDGFSVGLFLDQRDNRRRVRRHAAGRRVLNTFCYTGAFSVSAALGGAAETVSVDVSRKVLEWSKRNFAANGLSLDGHTFICSDVFDYLRRAARQRRRFDLIILDPPTFARAGKTGRTFSIESDLDPLAVAAKGVAAPGALLLLSTNHRATTAETLERAVRLASPAARCIEHPELPPDFPGDPHFSKSVWMQID